VGIAGGRVVFALYREPKLAAFMVLGWVLLAAFCWTRRKHLDVTPWSAISRRPELLLLLILTAYMALSLSWALVPENGLYEISQYGLLIALVLCLIIWSHDDEAVVSVVQWSLILSIGAAALIGLLQMVGLFSFLPPINPYDEVGYPSLMGYKNPMALAVLGQLFVLAGCIHARRSKRALSGQAFLWLLLLAEVFYLVTLLSRSSLVGLVLGTLFLALLRLLARPRGRQVAIGAVALPAVIVSVVVAAVMLNSSARDKARSVVGYLSHPATILESDRGIFALNTLTMVRSHPFGVGVGDWQSNYPVYRAHDRYFNFTDEKQLRRAHSDHVQMLGEIGWPGLALWLTFLALLIWRTARDGVHRKSISSQFLATQLVAMSVAMCTDYVTEFPYLKFQFFLVVGLSMISVPATSWPASRFVLNRSAATLLAVTTTIVAVVNVTYYAGFTRKLIVGGHLTRHYLSATAAAGAAGAELNHEGRARRELEACVRLGQQFGRLQGHTKTIFRDYLLIADASRRIHRHDDARHYLGRSLELNPYHVPAFRVMSLISKDETEALEWSEAADEVMNRSANGFHRMLPTGHPLSDRRNPAAALSLNRRHDINTTRVANRTRR
jgi:O-antigen ligase